MTEVCCAGAIPIRSQAIGGDTRPPFIVELAASATKPVFRRCSGEKRRRKTNLPGTVEPVL